MRDFAFDLDQRVLIAANGREGTVKGLYVDAGGEQFNVEYCDGNGLVSSHYFRTSEISAA